MKVIYIKEINSSFNFLEKLKIKIKKIFNIIDIINKNEKRIYYLPINCNKKNSKYKIDKLSKKIIKQLELDAINTVVLSKNLKSIDNLKNNLYRENITILDGRYLFKCLMVQVLEYIAYLKGLQISNIEVAILINEYSSLNKEIITEIANKVKITNIITNNINRFKKLEQYFYDEYGIILNISNNKKTSLLKTPIVINLDFPEELVNQYRIYNKAIIINVLEKIEIESKKFNGININYYKINIPDKYKMDGFKEEEICESRIYNYNYEKIRKELIKDGMQIEYLIGNNGIILEEEFK